MQGRSYIAAQGRQIAAARALADVTILQLADEAGTTPRMIAKIEASGTVQVSVKRRHGHVSANLWDRVIGALRKFGVELTDGGARWTARTPAEIAPVNDREAS